MSEPALFDMTPIPLPTPPASADPELSADRRRTLRQAEAIERGMHPLSLVSPRFGYLHPDAPRDRDGGGPRCGNCAHRKVLGYHDRAYPKCDRYFTHGAATDVRAWWPACGLYEAEAVAVEGESA